MTTHRQATDRALLRHHRELSALLEDIMDVDAGLREILVQSRHDDFTDRLDDILDTEAGLADILHSDTATKPAAPTFVQDFAVGIPNGRAPDRKRMAFRNSAPVEPLRRAFDSVRVLGAYVATLDSPRLMPRHVVSVDFASAHRRAEDMVTDLGHTVHRIAPHVGPDLLRDPQSWARNVAALATRAMENQEVRIAHIRTMRQDLADLLDWCVTAFQVLISRTLNHPAPRHRLRSPGWLDAFLNDFTGADLHSEDLAPMDLDGVRWSRDTRWPPAIDIEDLRNRSRETPTGSGIYIVKSGPATVIR